MPTFPQRYTVNANGQSSGTCLSLDSGPAPALAVSAPAHFGGTDANWSPETMLVGAVGSCFILSFMAIARASHSEWTSLDITVDGEFDKDGHDLLFTRFEINAVLVVNDADDIDRAEHLLEHAERTCLVSHSLSAETGLNAEVRIAA